MYFAIDFPQAADANLRVNLRRGQAGVSELDNFGGGFSLLR
jgi:hypothetical protein